MKSEDSSSEAGKVWDSATRDAILDGLPFSAIATDAEGLIVAANRAAEHLLGYDRDELIGRSVLSVHDSSELEAYAADLSRARGAPVPVDQNLIVAPAGRGEAHEWLYACRSGQKLPVSLTVTLLREKDRPPAGYLHIAHGIVQRPGTEPSIRDATQLDPLTGLPNRLLLVDRLEVAIRQAQRQDTQVAVLMIDLDHFKHVNDALGHMTGDQLLLAVSKRLQKCVRGGDTVARLGGDEFVAVLPGVRGREELAPFTTDIVRTLSSPMFIEDHELIVTPSIGACLYPEHGADAITLLRHADAAMYHAKSSGRGNVQWFLPSMVQRAEDKMAIGAALRRSIGGKSLSMHYQPEVSLKDGQVVGMEALVRWNHPEHGFVSPNRFIPIAEETGLILGLGEWALSTACRDCAAIQRELQKPLRLAVNVSPRQLQQKHLVRTVTRALTSSGLRPEQLELEITEGLLMHDHRESAEALQGLRELGVRVVIDDFGTGYSSLSYLTRFPVDKIKIDRSFLSDLGKDTADAAIVDVIIGMAYNLRLRVIAEGVETRQQQSFLQERGCHEAQGHLYGAAVPRAAFARLARDIESRSSLASG
jgi:diguanylate cyclase (GGDEF)-like protein/PAS domain S-box-containing protein